jgi:hypothetical protein
VGLGDRVVLGDGVTLAVSSGDKVVLVATGARRCVLHCSATRPNATTMTTSATVDTLSAVPKDVLSESHRGFLCMASVPPCEPLLAATFYPRTGGKNEHQGLSRLTVIKTGQPRD